MFIAQYSSRNHLFLRKFQKSFQVKRNEHVLKCEIYLITCKLSQKTDPKGEKQRYSLNSVNERRLLLFTFFLGSECCSFRGKHVLFHRKKIVYKDLRANAFHFVVFLIPFVRKKVHLFYAFKVSNVPVGLSVMQIQCTKSRARCFQYHAMQCCCNEIIKTT